MKYIILEDIRSAYNVGAIFRTADGAGVTKIFLTGYTPTPIDRFGRTQPDITKTSLGASSTVPWEHGESGDVIENLKAKGITVVAVEQVPTALPVKDFFEPEEVAYIFGNELTGVRSETLAASDSIVELPMCGEKESLNVSVAAGIVLYRTLISGEVR